MSSIHWSSRSHTSRLAGSERAHMACLVDDVAYSVIADEHHHGDHPLARVLTADHPDRAAFVGPPSSPGQRRDRQERVRMVLHGFLRPASLTFDGRTDRLSALALNTLVVTGSPALALLARLHGYCEQYAWVAEEDRGWLADVIDTGRRTNVLRPDQGWEDVAAHLRNGDGGPVVTSYSVGETWPHDSSWMASAWPEEQRVRGTYDWDALTEVEQQAVSERGEEWDELSEDERWKHALVDIGSRWWLQLTPQNLDRPMFGTTRSLWDLVVSDDWCGRTADPPVACPEGD